MSKWTEKIPSFLWIPIIIGAIALFIGGVFAIFYGFGYVEGFGSIIMLVLGWIGFRIGNNSDEKDVGKSLGVAVGLTIFALMGMALDQTGNFIYNKPLEWIFCPENTELMRETIKSGTKNGGIQLSQNYFCATQNGEVLRKISMFEHMAVRFIEYVVLGYILLGMSRLYAKLRGKR